MYVQSLRDAGWTTLERVILRTWQGSTISNEGDDLVISGNAIGDNSISNDDKSVQSSSTWYLVAILLPLSVVLVLSCVIVLWWTRKRVNWKDVFLPKAAVHPVWQMSDQSADVRSKALEMELYRDIDEALELDDSATQASESDCHMTGRAVADEKCPSSC